MMPERRMALMPFLIFFMVISYSTSFLLPLIARHQCNNICLYSSRREFTTALIAAPTSLLTPKDALASGGSEDGSLIYQGVYFDPKYPKGYRVIIGNKSSAILKLQDDPTGAVSCLPAKITLAADDTVKEFIFDFTSRGGSESTVGVFGKDKEGIPIITFPDGNTWKKRRTGIVGVYQDGLDSKKVWVVRQLKGMDLTVESIKGSEITTMSAKAGSPNILFDFPGEASGVPGKADILRNTITFENGNVWTKF